MHDEVASVASLARTMLTQVDDSRGETTVASASLRLVIETFLELEKQRASILPRAIPGRGTARDVEKGARQSVAGVIARIDEGRRQAAEEEADLFREG